MFGLFSFLISFAFHFINSRWNNVFNIPWIYNWATTRLKVILFSSNLRNVDTISLFKKEKFIVPPDLKWIFIYQSSQFIKYLSFTNKINTDLSDQNELCPLHMNSTESIESGICSSYNSRLVHNSFLLSTAICPSFKAPGQRPKCS